MSASRGRPMIRTIAMLALVASSTIVAGQTATYRAFASPEDAVQALFETVKKGDVDALLEGGLGRREYTLR